MATAKPPAAVGQATGAGSAIRGRGPRWLLAGVLALVAWAAAASTLRQTVDGDELVAALVDGELFLEARPQKGEGLYAFARRLTGDDETAPEIVQANGGRKRLLAGVRYRVPFPLLLNSYKAQVIQALFPDDQARPDGWHHRVPESLRDPSLWAISTWFTGRGQNFTTIWQHNGMTDDSIRPGQLLVIPRHLLTPTFANLLPPPAPVELTADGGAGTGPLSYTSDSSGNRFAVYRLRRGEALYSAVVVRFTGRVLADDVNDLAAELAELNGIRDVTDMPVGQPVRIPLDLLVPEYLPADDPRRQEWEANRTESAKYSNTVRASRLEGITVILDAGHGGDDPGVDFRGVWESVYVYDVMSRIKRLLEATTSAKVVATTGQDGGYAVPDRDVLPRSRSHRVLTDPPYPIRDVKVAAHLRWYLANSEYRKALRRSGDPGKTVFLSIHADSLHHSLRGAMAYVPSTSLTRGTFGKRGTVYASRREVKEQPTVTFSWKERTRSEGLSRQLAEQVIRSFRHHGLAVHREKPIRDRIVRCRRCRPFVPAVVRYNAIPTKLLLEVCNMSNSRDRELLKTRAFRQKVAVAVVDAILAYYGQDPVPPSSQVAAGE